MNYTYKQIWLVSLPVMMSLLTEQLINITDAIFLGHVGKVELGAAALAGLYYLAVYMLGFGFSLGLQVMIARRNGEKRYKDTGRTFFQGLGFLLLMAFIFLTVMKSASPYLLKRLISSEDVYNAVIAYLDWRCYGLLFSFPLLAFRSFFVGIAKTGILSISAIVMVSVNVLLNYLLIFGSHGFPKLGITGAAIASSASEMVSLLILIIYVAVRTDRKYYGLFPVWDKLLLIKVLRLSVWTMLYSFISVAPWFLFFVAIEHVGENQLAIANIIRSISTFFFVIVSAFATTAGAAVSYLIGANEKNKIKIVCRKIIYCAYMAGIPLIILILVFHNAVLGIYTDNSMLTEESLIPLIVMLSVYFISAPAHVFSNAVLGTGNTRISFVFQAIIISIYLIHLYILSISSTTSVAVYWTTEVLFVSLLLAFSYGYMRRWRKDLE